MNTRPSHRDRAWFIELSELFSIGEAALKSRLMSYNAQQFASRHGGSPLASRTISGWSKTKAPTPSHRTAVFLLSFIDWYTDDITDKSRLNSLREYLEIRSARGGEDARKSAPNDPLSICAGEKLKFSEYTTIELKKIDGLYRIIRFNTMTQKLSADLCLMKSDGRKIKPTLLTENGYIYTGVLCQSPFMNHIILVNKSPRMQGLGFSVRYLIFQISPKIPLDLVSGIMLRSSNSKSAPISSVVVIEKINEHMPPWISTLLDRAKSGDAADAMKYFDLQSLGLLGSIPIESPEAAKYTEMLSDSERGEIIMPITPVDIKDLLRIEAS